MSDWIHATAFRRRWWLRIRPFVCLILGHRPVERYEEEKFDLSNLGKMEKVRFCWRCRKHLEETND